MEYHLDFRMKRHIKIIVLVLGIFVFPNLSKAQLIPNFGAQRAGLSTLSFLKNDMSPRSTALSGSSVALNADGFSVFTNPAAIADINMFTASVSNYTLGAGIQQSFVSVLLPREKKLSTFGFSLNILNSGEMDVRTEFQPEGTGEKFYVTNMALGLTYAQQLSDMFSAGLSLKYIHEQIDDFTNSTITADVSFLYKTDYKDLNFAVMIQNFGGSSSISGDDIPTDFNRNLSPEADNYSVPTVFSLGASVVPWKVEKQSLLFSLQLNHPTDNSENYRIGVEYEYLKLLFLRAGYKLNVNGQPYPTFGFGLRHRVGGHPLSLNYAANPSEYLGILHTVGLSFSFNKMERE